MNWPWFKFWLAWVDDPDFDNLPLEAQAIFIRMLGVQWREGSLPSDIEDLARKCRVRFTAMQTHLQRLMPLLMQQDDGTYVFEQMESDRQRCESVAKSRSELAKRRWNRVTDAKASANESPKAYAFDNADANRSKKLEVRSKKKEKSEKDSCTAASAAPASPTLVRLPLNDGSEHSITKADVDEFRKLYPAVDVEQACRDMRGWLLGNPRNKKTSSGVLRFVHSWLKREQDKAPVRVGSEAAVGTQRAPEPPRERKPSIALPGGLDEQAGRKAWDAVRDALRLGINPHSFDTWLKPTRGIGVSGGALFVKVPTQEFMHVGEKYGEAITAAVQRIGLNSVRLFYEVNA